MEESGGKGGSRVLKKGGVVTFIVILLIERLYGRSFRVMQPPHHRLDLSMRVHESCFRLNLQPRPHGLAPISCKTTVAFPIPRSPSLTSITSSAPEPGAAIT